MFNRKVFLAISILAASISSLADATIEEAGGAATVVCDFNKAQNHDFGGGVLSLTVDTNRAKVSVKCSAPAPDGFCLSGSQVGGNTQWVLKSRVNFEGQKTDFSDLGKTTNLYVIEGNNQDDQQFLLNLMVSYSSIRKNGVHTQEPSAQAYIVVMEGYDNIEGNTGAVNCQISAK